MLGLGLTASSASAPIASKEADLLAQFIRRVEGDGGKVEDTPSVQEDMNLLTSGGDRFVRGIIDIYDAAAGAYSLRRLNNSYSGYCVEVQRTDNSGDTKDIGFLDNGEIDENTLREFCEGKECRIKTWYDQSGNSNDATQSTFANMPRIMDDDTEFFNIGTHKAVLFEDARPSVLHMNHSDLKNQAQFDFFMHFFSTDEKHIMFNNNSDGGQYSFVATKDHDTDEYATVLAGTFGSFGTTAKLFINGSEMSITDGTTTRDDVYDFMIANGSTNNINKGAIQVQQGKTTGWGDLAMSEYTSFQFKGRVTEFIIYNTDQSSNRGDIERAINHHYNVY